MSVKACSKCGEVKPLEDYSPDKQNKDGRQSACKTCKAASQRAYRKANPEKEAARKRAYQQANKEKATATKRAWRQANPEKANAAQERRRARKEGNGVYLVTGKEMARLYASPCAECGSTENIEADHVVPISRGGQHSIGNLQALCRSCNSSKNDRLQVEWRHGKMKTLAA